MQDKQKSTFQLVWGLLLLMAGILLPFRVHQIIPEIKKIGHFAMVFVYFSFYLVAVLLILGGGRKVYHYIKQSKQDNSNI